MKVDKDLRAAITAAAKNQTSPSYGDVEKFKADQVSAFLKERPELLKKIKLARSRLDKTQAANNKAIKDLDALVDPVGIKRDISTIAYGDDAEAKFKKSGGVLPPPKKRIWKPEQCVAELAMAPDQKAFDSVLKKYGIVWK